MGHSRTCVTVLVCFLSLELLSTSQILLTVHPFPMLQPTTPHALPLARTCKGKISAGYSHGTVSQVAPNPAVKIKVNVAAAAPYCAFWGLLLIASLESPPERNIETPMMQEPQNKVFRRPRRSRVKTATNVENFGMSVSVKRSDAVHHTM